MTEVVQASGIRPGALNAGVVICAVVSDEEYRLRGGRLILVLHFCYRVSVSEDAEYDPFSLRL